MPDWYVEVSNLFRQMRDKAFDALTYLHAGNAEVAEGIKVYIRDDYEGLRHRWPKADVQEFGRVSQHIGFGAEVDYRDLLMTYRGLGVTSTVTAYAGLSRMLTERLVGKTRIVSAPSA